METNTRSAAAADIIRRGSAVVTAVPDTVGDAAPGPMWPDAVVVVPAGLPADGPDTLSSGGLKPEPTLSGVRWGLQTAHALETARELGETPAPPGRGDAVIGWRTDGSLFFARRAHGLEPLPGGYGAALEAASAPEDRTPPSTVHSEEPEGVRILGALYEAEVIGALEAFEKIAAAGGVPKPRRWTVVLEILNCTGYRLDAGAPGRPANSVGMRSAPRGKVRPPRIGAYHADTWSWTVETASPAAAAAGLNEAFAEARASFGFEGDALRSGLPRTPTRRAG